MLYLSFYGEKDQNNQKEAGIGLHLKRLWSASSPTAQTVQVCIHRKYFMVRRERKEVRVGSFGKKVKKKKGRSYYSRSAGKGRREALDAMPYDDDDDDV